MEQTHITKGHYTTKPEPGMVLVANFGLGSFIMAPAGTKPGDPQATAEFFARCANDATDDSARSSEIQTAMALWEAVLDARERDLQEQAPTPLVEAFEGWGFSELRHMAMALITACESAWSKIGNDYTDAWDWEFLPIVVSLWIEANFDASAVTVEKIIAAAMPTKEG